MFGKTLNEHLLSKAAVFSYHPSHKVSVFRVGAINEIIISN